MKDTVKRRRRWATTWEKMFAKVTPDKELLSKIYKNIPQIQEQENKQVGKGSTRHLAKEGIQMASKRMRRCSTSCASRGLQIQTMTRHHYAFVTGKTQDTDHTRCWWGWGAGGALRRCRWEREEVQPLWRTAWRCFTRLNTVLPCDRATGLLGIYPKELGLTATRAHVCGSLSLIANAWRQPSCPSASRWVNQLWPVRWENMVQH